jgi:hypothetical protein
MPDEVTKCQGCGARIIFGYLPKGGCLPLDAEPSRQRGSVRLDLDGNMGPVPFAPEVPVLSGRYTRHWCDEFVHGNFNGNRLHRPASATVKYDDYIRSQEWRAFVNRLKDDRGHDCQTCGIGEGDRILYFAAGRRPREFLAKLDGDHLTYDRLGHEFRSDVRIACTICHVTRHYQQNPLFQLRDPTSLAELVFEWLTHELIPLLKPHALADGEIDFWELSSTKSKQPAACQNLGCGVTGD